MSREHALRPGVSRTTLWATVIFAAAVLAWALAGTAQFVLAAPAAFWAMALAGLIVDIPLYTERRGWQQRSRATLSPCFTFAIFVLWGAAPAIAVQAVAAAAAAIAQHHRNPAVLHIVARVLGAVAVAQLVVNIAGLRPSGGASLDGSDLVGFLLLALVYLAVSLGLSAAAPRPRRLREDVTIAATILVVSPLLTVVPQWWSLIVAAPLMLVHFFARQHWHQQEDLGREPASGLLNQQGLAGGMRALTDFDLVASQDPRPFGIVLINLESVLTINRTLGLDLYEHAFNLAARRVVETYGADRVGRLSGEWIVILAPDLTERDAVAFAEEAVRVLAAPIDVDGIPFSLDPVGGVALSPQHGRQLDTLLAKAELAVTEARRQARTAALYVRQATETAQRHMALLRELRNTLDNPARHGEITLVYQPQVDLATGELSGVEALVRWTHPEWGPVHTEDLIEAVEASEVMHLLTRHVLRVAVGTLRRWQENGRPLKMAVNVSVQDLHNTGFADELGALLSASGIPPSLLTIEVTERMLMTDAPRVAQVAGVLRSHGVGLSLDDFGTGHASLQQLRQLPITQVKIDRSYVGSMADNPADRAIVASVHQLATTLNIAVVAEGVENRRIVQCLAGFAGMIGQGWYFGRPMTAEKLEQWHPPRHFPPDGCGEPSAATPAPDSAFESGRVSS